MTRRHARLGLAALALAGLLGGALLLASPGAGPEPRAEAERPLLMLLTTLPLLFPETFTLESAGSPALAALQSRYQVVPISVGSASELGKQPLLLMAQPQAQPAEALVELDAWVRGGGRVLLLADPALEWPSERGLGDRLRPPTAFADTGLLHHWGLALQGAEAAGPGQARAGDDDVRTLAPGSLRATGKACAVVPGGLVARCTLGKGKATVIADSDLLNPAAIEGADESANFALVLQELERLER